MIRTKNIIAEDLLNPSNILFKQIRSSIDRTRKCLFNELEKNSPLISDTAYKILTEKLSGSKRPLVGEFLPWILADLAQIDKRLVLKASVGWLALYLYVIFLDKHLDKKINISAEEFLTGSLLAKTGLLKLSSIISKKEFKKIFEYSLGNSAKYQLDDVINREQTDLILNKRKSAEGKNFILLACGVALASMKEEKAKFILNFTKSLMLPLQYLDDLGDWEEDIIENNMTVLLSLTLNKTNQQRFNNLTKIKSNDILSLMITNGSLKRVLKKTYDLLTQTLLLIDTEGIKANKSYSYNYLSSLLNRINSLHNYLKRVEGSFSALNKTKQIQTIEYIRKDIQIIAQSS